MASPLEGRKVAPRRALKCGIFHRNKNKECAVRKGAQQISEVVNLLFNLNVENFKLE